MQEPPTAILDAKGNLVTKNKALDKLSLEMYREILTSHNIKENLKVHQAQREAMCKKQINEAQNNVTPYWSIEDLEIVLKQLKNGKSHNPLGYANELFKPENAGTDLKQAVLQMSNGMKKQQVFPQALSMCNITSLYKNKGSRKYYNNYRGVTVLRSIVDKLIYNDEYQSIDEHLTDSNVGTRRS